MSAHWPAQRPAQRPPQEPRKPRLWVLALTVLLIPAGLLFIALFGLALYFDHAPPSHRTASQPDSEPAPGAIVIDDAHCLFADVDNGKVSADDCIVPVIPSSTAAKAALAAATIVYVVQCDQLETVFPAAVVKSKQRSGCAPRGKLYPHDLYGDAYVTALHKRYPEFRGPLLVAIDDTEKEDDLRFAIVMLLTGVALCGGGAIAFRQERRRGADSPAPK